ncbi:MAG TPA: hypothetical protein VF042_15935 [Gemmatimonadaceae bacterium]
MWKRRAIPVLALTFFPCALSAQNNADASAGVHNPVLVTAASAIVPGAGQAIMRQKRSAIYLALEAAGLGYYFARHNRGVRDRDTYRGLSRTVARAEFSPNGPSGNWDYFERMEKYVESGVYDVVNGGDVDPESNEETFNGAMWLLARQTFWRDPAVPPGRESTEYRSAIEFYVSRAVKPEYRWSWSGNPEAFQRFRAAIASSNSAFRDADQIISLVLANHFLSAVDAYTSVRLRLRKAGNGSTALVGSWSF